MHDGLYEIKFWSKVGWPEVHTYSDCWPWAGTRTNGWGVATVPGVGCTGAHRVAYEFVNGAIPQGLSIDHLCRNRACVNPAHLEAVTVSENTRRMVQYHRDHPGERKVVYYPRPVKRPRAPRSPNGKLGAMTEGARRAQAFLDSLNP